jgi:DNA-binding transcriptional MerR regulator
MKAPKNQIVKAHFLSKELANLCGLSGYMVSYLCRQGLLNPKILVAAQQPNSGRRFGKARLFSFADLLLGRSISKLLHAGVSVKHVHASMRVLEEKLGRARLDLTRARITIIGRQIYLESHGESPVDLTNDGQLAFSYMLELDQLRARADKVIAGRSKSDRQRVLRHSKRDADLREEA